MASMSWSIVDNTSKYCAAIMNQSGYQTSRAVQNMTPIGYGNFVNVTGTPYSTWSLPSTPSITTTNPATEVVEFNVEMNLNPNSCDLS